MKIQIKGLGILLLGLGILSIGSCANDHKDDPATVLPTVNIQIQSPAENQEYHLGDTMKFNATISASADLHGWGVALRRKGDDSLVYSWTNHYHASSYTINQFRIDSLNQDTSLILTIDAAINHTGDLVSKTVNVKARKD